MSDQNTTQKCQTSSQTEMSDEHIRTNVSQENVSHIVKKCTSMHFHDCFDFLFPRNPILGTQRYPNIKEMPENIKETAAHIAISCFPENPRVP